MTVKNTFYPLTVDEIRRETRDAVSIRLAVPPALADLFMFEAGQYVTLRAEIAGEEIRRNYSLCVSPSEGELRVAVKALPGGRFSTYAHQKLAAGDVIVVMPPAGHFVAPTAKAGALYAAFAAGSGITPVVAIMKSVLARDGQSRFKLFYGNRTSGDILFLEALAALKDKYMGRVEVYHFLSAEESEIALFNGRLDQPKCREILEVLVEPAAVERFFICGPEGMMAAAEAALLAAGVVPEAILLERFTAAAGPVSEAAQAVVREASGRRMGVELEGRKSTVLFDAALGHILDSVRAAGLPAPYACKGGVCATCRARLVSGAVDMRVNYGLTPEEVAQGYILTCQATPRGDDVVISYDV